MVRFLILYDTPYDTKAFDRHYREVHIPIAKQLPGLRRYTLSKNPKQGRGDEPYYLIAELDWDDRESLERAFQSPAGKATAQDVADNLLKLTPKMHTMSYELEDVV